MSFHNYERQTPTDTSSNIDAEANNDPARENDTGNASEGTGALAVPAGPITVSDSEHARLICEAEEQGNPRISFEGDAASYLEHRNEDDDGE